MFDEAIAKAEGLLDELKALATRASDEAEAAKEAPAPELAAPEALPVAPVIALPATPVPDAESIRIAEEGHDNSLPFKCPGCGRTYEAQVTCTAGHPGELTLPTADVLDGAAPTDAETAAAATLSPVAAAETTEGADGGDAPT